MNDCCYKPLNLGIACNGDNQTGPFETLERWFDQSLTRLPIKCCYYLNRITVKGWEHRFLQKATVTFMRCLKISYHCFSSPKCFSEVISCLKWEGTKMGWWCSMPQSDCKMLSNMEGMWHSLNQRREFCFLWRTVNFTLFDSFQRIRGRESIVL